MTTSQIVTVVFLAVCIVAAIAFVVWCVRTHNYKKLSAVAYKLVLEAENKFAEEGVKTGDTKFGWVAKQLLNYMPPIVKAFIPASALEDIIEAAVELLKEQLAKAAETDTEEAVTADKAD